MCGMLGLTQTGEVGGIAVWHLEATCTQPTEQRLVTKTHKPLPRSLVYPACT